MFEKSEEVRAFNEAFDNPAMMAFALNRASVWLNIVEKCSTQRQKDAGYEFLKKHYGAIQEFENERWTADKSALATFSDKMLPVLKQEVARLRKLWGI